ncbi:MAG TPA: hypothetical protein ENK18_01390 [Deltaproteobacteria bacterium]|nr:hypothetical protein [Deltaproteobacteria bacterium]
MRHRVWLFVEAILIVASIASALYAADLALDRSLEQAALRTGELLRTPEEVQDAGRMGLIYFSIGAVVLFVGSVIGRWRTAARAIPIPLLLPATIGAAGLGLALQMGYGDPLRGPGWPGPTFAGGVMIGGIIGGCIFATPWDWERVAGRLRYVLLGGILVTFAALTLFGDGPTGSGTKINLGPFQPLELVKIAFVAFVAVFLGRRAASLRYQRNFLLGGLLRIPRPRLLLPALLVLVGLFFGLFLVRDLGPILILGLVFLTLFTIVTRSAPWALLALGLVASAVGVVALAPDLVGSDSLALRMRMWLDPWTNALPNGDQLASSRWAIAAGGLLGQGFGHGHIGALPAGQTDLVMAHLTEELGFAGLASYLAMIAMIVTSGVWVAAQNRTAERVLMASGLAALLASQWLVIFGGTTGLLPLTGVIVPFLSAGRTSMISFLALVALMGSLARDGIARAQTDELEQLRGGVFGVGTVFVGLFVGALGVGFAQSVLLGPATTARGVVTTLGDGTVVHRQDRRIQAIASSVPRGDLRDRNGLRIVGDDKTGERVYPLQTAMGTLIGPPTAVVLRPSWALERIYDERLRGYGDRPDGPSVWMVAEDDGTESLLFASPTRKERPRDRKRAEALAGGRSIRQLPLPAPDLRPLVPILHAPPKERPSRIVEAVGTLDDRSVTLTIDANLQSLAAETLATYAEHSKVGAAAAVVIDVDSGEVLVRAQVPDFDPSDRDSWLPPVLAADPAFTGVYGAWNDMTGTRGIFQAGSVGKIVTSVAYVREGIETTGEACEIKSVDRYSCTERDRQGPLFTMPGWRRPIHDYYKDKPHGSVDLARALSVSCNVTFGQMALKLGPEPFQQLVADGLQVGWSDTFTPGDAGTRTLAETGFGQGATAMSVSQAARLAALVGGGGIYRECPSDLEKGRPCEALELVVDPDALKVVLAGMRGTMTRGTGSQHREIEGVRVYGKTGTADSIGLRDEEPYDMIYGEGGYPPHSWFVAVAEPELASPCEAVTPNRLAIAVVVPRSGTGAAFAAPTALKILAGAHQLGYLGGER